MITSSSNAQVKNIIALNKKAKERREQDVFVAEGWKMFQEAPREWLKKVYVSESGSKMHEMPSDGTEYEVVDDRVFQSMCDTKTPQGVLSVIRMPHYTEEEVMDNGKTPLLMVLEDLQDPGNVGTIIRTAEGAGVTGIIMSRGTADIFNPKTIRSTMGSIYRMPFLIVDDAVGFVKGLKARKICTYAAHLHGVHSYREEDYTTYFSVRESLEVRLGRFGRPSSAMATRFFSVSSGILTTNTSSLVSSRISSQDALHSYQLLPLSISG